MEEKEVQYITPELPPPPVYIESFAVENVKCFQEEQTISFSNEKKNLVQWTVILGNNNTGKTTLLKCLAGLERVGMIVKFRSPFFSILIHYKKQLFGSEYSTINTSYRVFYDRLIQPHSLFHSEFTNYSDLFYSIKCNDRFIVNEGRESSEFPGAIIFSYGTARKTADSKITENFSEEKQHNIFNNIHLSNVEDWLLNLFLANRLGQEKAQNTLDIAKTVITNGILPDVFDLEFKSKNQGTSFENFVLFKTDYGLIRLHELGYGYQTMVAWILDLVRRMVERYPDSSNPLAEPAIVLVDEIDLHLHPDWQRKIIAHLTKHFPNTQFIVTAHSPLIVQSAEEVNLVILKKENDRVVVDQPKIRSFKGWTVEEIMTDLMQLEGQTMSNTYLSLMTQFDEALDEDDYEKAQSAYNQLDAILHPQSSQRKLLRLQMSALSQPNIV